MNLSGLSHGIREENEGHKITGHLTIHIDHCLTKNKTNAGIPYHAKQNPKHGSTIQHNLTLPVINLDYLLTNWFAYLYGRIQSPRPDVMPDRREAITRAAGFVFACIDTQTS